MVSINTDSGGMVTTENLPPFNIYGYLVLLVVLVIISIPLFLYQHKDYGSFFGLLGLNHTFTMPIHEGGHALLYGLLYLPFLNKDSMPFLVTSAGSIIQIAFPLLIFIYKFWKKEYIVSFISFWWFGLNIVDTSIYIDQALNTTGSFITPFGPVENPEDTDFSFLFRTIGILNYHHQIASVTYWIGIVMMFFAFVFLGRYLYQRLTFRGILTDK